MCRPFIARRAIYATASDRDDYVERADWLPGGFANSQDGIDNSTLGSLERPDAVRAAGSDNARRGKDDSDATKSGEHRAVATVHAVYQSRFYASCRRTKSTKVSVRRTGRVSGGDKFDSCGG
jgi:hypothetical protein